MADPFALCNGSFLYPINLAGYNQPLTFNYNDEIIASWTSTCSFPEFIVWGPNNDDSAQIICMRVQDWTAFEVAMVLLTQIRAQGTGQMS